MISSCVTFGAPVIPGLPASPFIEHPSHLSHLSTSFSLNPYVGANGCWCCDRRDGWCRHLHAVRRAVGRGASRHLNARPRSCICGALDEASRPRVSVSSYPVSYICLLLPATRCFHSQSAPDPKVKGLKRTLTNGGLMPDPNNKKLVSRPSGSMAVFTEGGPALGGAESGASN